MKRALAVGSVALVLLGIPAVPASADFERGVNCHMNEIFVRASGDSLHFEMKISNRSGVRHRNLCEFKFRTSEEIWTVTRVCTLPARTFCIRRGNVDFDGVFRVWRWTHGHVV